MAVDLDAVERELCRIPEVRAARIVADETGAPVEIHVLAAPGKHAKQLVRDVQSVAIATQGLEIDHRMVSIVQLDDDDVPAGSAIGDPSAAPHTDGTDANGAPRTVLDGVVVSRQDMRCHAVVRLRCAADVVEGSAEGSASSTNIRRIVAEATLDALTQLRPVATCAAVEAASVVRIGEKDVAVAVLSLVVPPYEEVVTGSAPVRASSPDEAISRAVLDACNRRLLRMEQQ